MKHLLYKELRLAIHPFYYGLPVLTGALMLIPQWIFFLVPLYFCFISASNLFSTFKSNNDLGFSAMLPIAKADIVKARILAIVLVELLHIFWALVFAVANRLIYQTDNFAFDLNPAFFGLVFVMFALFNLIFFPQFYRTGHAFGFPVILATVGAIAFSTVSELLAVFSLPFQAVMEESVTGQVVTLAAGILFFAAAGFAAAAFSIPRFKQVDIS